MNWIIPEDLQWSQSIWNSFLLNLHPVCNQYVNIIFFVLHLYRLVQSNSTFSLKNLSTLAPSPQKVSTCDCGEEVLSSHHTCIFCEKKMHAYHGLPYSDEEGSGARRICFCCAQLNKL